GKRCTTANHPARLSSVELDFVTMLAIVNAWREQVACSAPESKFHRTTDGAASSAVDYDQQFPGSMTDTKCVHDPEPVLDLAEATDAVYGSVIGYDERRIADSVAAAHAPAFEQVIGRDSQRPVSLARNLRVRAF